MTSEYPHQTPSGLTDSQYATVLESTGTLHSWMHAVVVAELHRLVESSNWRDAYLLIKRARKEHLAPFLEESVGSSIINGSTLVEELSALQRSKHKLPNQPENLATAKKKTKTDGLKAAMLAGIEDYKKRYANPPSARALFNWMKTSDSTDTIAEYDEIKDALVWQCADGKLKTTTFKSFENRMSGIRKTTG